MRKLARRLLVWKLGWATRLVLRKYQPKIVAITGSVGKTTTRDLTAAMLETRYRLRKTIGDYNTEIGLPLTVLGQKLPKGLGWFGVFRHTVWLLVGKRDYPELLVLEMAADHPGDIQHLSSIAPPDAAIITNVRPVHLEFYDSVEEIAEEKSWVVRNLNPAGAAILNFDDDHTRLMRALKPKQTLFYGLSDEAHVWADDIKQSPRGLTANVHFRGSDEGDPDETWKLSTPLVGVHQLYGVLAALSAALSFGVNGKKALAVAKDFQPPAGRGRVLDGKDGLTIIDDTYNASPEAVLASLEMLRQFPGPHRAILGDMKELGKVREQGHRMVGQHVADWLDELVAVGDDAAIIAHTARERGMDEAKIKVASNGREAAKLLSGGGTVLVKGSHSMQLEDAVVELLAHPKDKKLTLAG